MVDSALEDIYNKVLPYLTIDVNSISDEMVRHTAGYAYLAQELARAKGRAADLKNDLEYKKAVALIESKGLTISDGLGKEIAVTDTVAKACVDASEHVLAAKKELTRAERNLAFWQSILDAMYQRSYMLTKLAEMQQHELMLAGNEYNEGIRQGLKAEVGNSDFDRITKGAQMAKKQSQFETMRDAVKQNRKG